MILCADDFGISPGVNKAIIELAANGRLTAVSCMVTNSFDRTELDQLVQFRDHIDLGLHFTLSDSKPVGNWTMESGLIQNSNTFQNYPHLFKNLIFRRISFSSIYKELQLQVERFRSLFGFWPRFIDGHQHVHHLPIVRSALALFIQNEGIHQETYCRVSISPFKSMIPLFSNNIKLLASSILISTPSYKLRKMLDLNNIYHNRFLFGHYLPIEGRNGQFADIFMKYIKVGPSKSDVFFCHPGKVDEILRSRDSLLSPREDVYSFLSSRQMDLLINDHEIVLNRFKDPLDIPV